MPNRHQHVLDAARHLLKNGFAAEAVTAALGIVGEGAGVDRVYLFENSVDGETCSQRFEWSGGAPPQLDNPELQDLPWKALAPSWPGILAGDGVIGGLVADMDPAIQGLLREQGIISLLVCPILLDGRWWGFVGFDDCHSDRLWPDEEVALLRSLARALAGVMRHEQTKSRLDLARQQLQEILAR
jgi:GAF domain-containing protein